MAGMNELTSWGLINGINSFISHQLSIPFILAGITSLVLLSGRYLACWLVDPAEFQ